MTEPVRTLNLRVIARNVAGTWAVTVVSMLTLLFLTPFVISHVGKVGYGVWLITNSILAYLDILGFGVGGVTKHVAARRVHRDWVGVNQVINTSLMLLLPACALALLGTVLLAWQAPFWLKLDGFPPDQARWVILLSGAALSLSLLASTINRLFAGFERYDISNLIQIGVTLSQAALFVVVLQQGGGLVQMATVALAVTCVSVMLRWYFARRLFPSLNIYPRKYVDRATLRLLAGYSGFTLLLTLLTIVQQEFAALLLGFQKGVSAVAVYVVAQSLVGYLGNFAWGMVSVLIPTVSAMDASGQSQVIIKTWFTATRLALGGIGLFFALLAVAGPAFIVIWLGSDFRESGAIVTIIAVGAWIGLSRHMVSIVFQGTGRLARLTYWSIVNTALSLMLMYVGLLQQGLVGMACGGVLGGLFASFVHITILLKELQARWPHFLMQTLLPALPGLLVAAALAWAMLRLVAPVGFISLALTLLPALLGGAVVAFWVCLRREERVVVINVAVKLLHYFSSRG